MSTAFRFQPDGSVKAEGDTDSMTTVSADPASVTTILQVAGGAVLPRCLHAIANLGVADALGDQPQSADILAQATGVHPEALARAMRLLAANGVFEYSHGLFAHSPASRLLRSDHPQSLRQLARMFGLDAFWPMIGDLEYPSKPACRQLITCSTVAFGVTCRPTPTRAGCSTTP